jgi:hypothetical protein
MKRGRRAKLVGLSATDAIAQGDKGYAVDAKTFTHPKKQNDCDLIDADMRNATAHVGATPDQQRSFKSA